MKTSINITQRFGMLLMLLLCVSPLFTPETQAQDTNCAGLKNPINFNLYISPVSGKWSAKLGTKQAVVSTCFSNASVTWGGTVLTGNAIATATGGSSCYSQLGTDYMNEFVIKGRGTDPLTNNLLTLTPDTSLFHDTTFQRSIRIGNACGGTEANMLCYDFKVKKKNALVFIYFSISLYNALHDAAHNPEFTIKIKKQDASGNWETVSDTMCYIVQSPTSSSNLGVFQNGGTDNIYRPWAKVAINLYKYLYQNIRIEITTGDCAYTAHYGYGYVAGSCQPMELVASGCAAGENDTAATIAAPSGLESYQWYRCKTGITTSEAYNDANIYELMPGRTDSMLAILNDDFVNQTDGDTIPQRTFLCRMMSRMNPAYPIYSNLTVNVGNMKPILAVDSLLECGGRVFIRDRSEVLFTNDDDSNKVDTANTKWIIYNSSSPNDADVLDTIIGPYMDYTFEEGGQHSVVVHTSAYRSSCWNEKTIRIRSLAVPTPKVEISKRIYCIGDTVQIMNMTPNPLLPAQYASYTKYVVHRKAGDTIIKNIGTNVGARRLKFVCDSTATRVEMWTRTDQISVQDTDGNGTLDSTYCFAHLDTIVYAQRYPKLKVLGDTIVCYGNSSEVSVENSNPEACSFAWYRQRNGDNPIGTNQNFSEPNVTTNKMYFVKVETNDAHCATWDSIIISLVEPTLNAPVTRMCTGDRVYLYAGGASKYNWSAMPDDPSLSGQQENDTIRVSPRQNTTYTLIGHGTNDCNADPLTMQIEVFPYPIPTFTLDPGFIDSEKPTVTFSDISPNSVSSLWTFGTGLTSTQRTVSHTFTDISQDSILVALSSSNQLGCKSDTTFWVPIDLFAVWFPNAFTPTLNSNKTFHVFTHNELRYYSLYIYDRRGNLVFHSTDQNKAWDGTYKGKLCDAGAYVYVCNYRRDGTYETSTIQGTVLLLQ